MESMVIVLVIVAVLLAAAFFILCNSYSKLNRRYLDLLDEFERVNDTFPDIDRNHFRLIRTMGYQCSVLNSLLFTLLLDIVNENDEEVAMNRFLDLRDKAITMNTSKSKYVRDAYKLAKSGKGNTSTIMYWLCALLDVRNGKESLSDYMRDRYGTLKHHIVVEQHSLLNIENDIKEDEKRYELEKAKKKENYEESPEDNSEVPDEEDEEEFEEWSQNIKTPFDAIKMLFSRNTENNISYDIDN